MSALSMAVIKIAAAVGMVVLLSLLAEHVSARFAGVFSGYPLGAAVSLFFIAVEISPRFAADSAVFTMAGLVGTEVFVFGYYLVSDRTRNAPLTVSILLSTAGGLAGYFLALYLLQLMPLNLPAALIIGAAGAAVFNRLFQRVPNVRIERRGRITWQVLAWRAAAAAAVVMAVTSTAHLIGPRWAGLFAAFPMTILPLVVIIHALYRVEHVHTVLKNVPRGLGAALGYSLVVALTYPLLGLLWGTLLGYLLATAYLLLINRPRRPLHPRPHRST